MNCLRREKSGVDSVTLGVQEMYIPDMREHSNVSIRHTGNRKSRVRPSHTLKLWTYGGKLKLLDVETLCNHLGEPLTCNGRAD